MKWFYAEQGKSCGPVDEDAFRGLVQAGVIRAETLVWQEGLPAWVPYGQLTTGQVSLPAQGTAACRACGNTFPQAEMVFHGGGHVCAACKPAYFQRIQEGALDGGNAPNGELTARAREHLRGLWGRSIGILVIHGLISFAASLATVAAVLITGPFALGLAMYFLGVARRMDPPLATLFAGFQRFGQAIAVWFLTALFVGLWTLLLIVPGIVAAFAYSQAYYILADEPDIGPLEAIRKSKELMRGHKWKFFCLGLRFVGWYLLCILTLFIGCLWVAPYQAAAYAEFYRDLRGR